MTVAMKRSGFQPFWDKDERFPLRFKWVFTPRYPQPTPQMLEYRATHPRVVATETTMYRQPTSHAFHLIMSLVTCGAWLPIWFLITILHKAGPRHKSVAVTTRYPQ